MAEIKDAEEENKFDFAFTWMVVNKERVKRGDPESKLKIDNKQLEKKVADRAALVTNADGTRRAEGNQHIMIANLDRTDMEACFNLDDAKKIIKPSSWIEVCIDGEAEPVVFSPKPSPYNGGLSINKFASALVNNYKPAFLYFEIFECLYKVSIVGLMIFYNAGTIEQVCALESILTSFATAKSRCEPSADRFSSLQHILGLLICFVAACTYNNLKPYNKVVNNWTQQIAQFAIVITLLMAMVMLYGKYDATGSQSDSMGIILAFFLFLSGFMSIVFGVIGEPRLPCRPPYSR